MWALQAEFSLPIFLRVRPYVFGDVGNAGEVDRVWRQEPLVGIGGGLAISLLIAELRIEAASPLASRTGITNNLRLDLRIH